MADDNRTRDLRRKSMPGGGEVFSGPLADEALAAVGARAMTMDHTILVSEDFDPNDPEDQALYAHERHHLNQSGGAHEHGGGKDAEEHAARAVEKMVLHRSAAGEDLSSILADVDQGRIGDPTESGGPAEAHGTDGNDPLAAYRKLRAHGWTHDTIVRMLADNVMQELRRSEGDRSERGPLKPSTI
jgi:hypothetical protein